MITKLIEDYKFIVNNGVKKEVGVFIEHNALGDSSLSYRLDNTDLLVSSPIGQYTFKSLSETLINAIKHKNELHLVLLGEDRTLVAKKA